MNTNKRNSIRLTPTYLRPTTYLWSTPPLGTPLHTSEPNIYEPPPITGNHYRPPSYPTASILTLSPIIPNHCWSIRNNSTNRSLGLLLRHSRTDTYLHIHGQRKHTYPSKEEATLSIINHYC